MSHRLVKSIWGSIALAICRRRGHVSNGQENSATFIHRPTVFKRLNRAFLGLALVLASLFVISSGNAATTLPTGFVSEVVIPGSAGLYGPTAMAFGAGNRIYIAQKDGTVRVWQDGTMLPTLFIDLSAEVNDYQDRGLLGIALHPDFPTTPYVYLLYTYDPPGVTPDAAGARVSRLLRVSADATNPNVASTQAGSRVVLLGKNSTAANIGDPTRVDNFSAPSCQSGNTYVQDCIPSDGASHSIGTVIFGPDGALYAGSGDAADYYGVDRRALRALDIDSLSGKIFRINPITGQGYTDNPFYDGNADSNRSKVYSLGLRNPFRFTTHPTTGGVFIGDVGWNNWEEVNTGKGKNFGWPCYEGNNTGSARQESYASDATTQSRCNTLYSAGLGAVQAPAAAYSHSEGSSIQAGAFYMGSIYPTQYQGALFIEDYSSDWIKYVTFDAAGKGTIQDFGVDVAPNGGGPVHLTVGPDSNLYYVILNYGENVSEVRRIRYTAGGNTPPTAKASATPTSGSVPLTVRFSSAGSFDPDSQPITYLWAFGNGQTSTADNPTYTYNTAGTFTATLTVKDSAGATGTSQVVITAGGNAPQITISSPTNNAIYTVGNSVSFSGSASDVQDGNLSASIKWTLLLRHNDHIHFDIFTATGASGSFVAQDHGDDNTSLELCASVTDRSGLTAQKCVALLPRKVAYTFTSRPSGLTLSYAGVSRVTPFTVNAIVNSKRQVIAPSTQSGLNFMSWSDGGANSHLAVIQSTNQTLTASYGRFVSDFTPTSVVGTYKKDLSIGGRVLTLNGVQYSKGIGVGGKSELQYNLGGAYQTFLADVGVDDEVGSNGWVIFSVYLDNVKVYDSGLMTGNTATKKINLNVAGKSLLKLVVTSYGGPVYDHADWALARLVR